MPPVLPAQAATETRLAGSRFAISNFKFFLTHAMQDNCPQNDFNKEDMSSLYLFVKSDCVYEHKQPETSFSLQLWFWGEMRAHTRVRVH